MNSYPSIPSIPTMGFPDRVGFHEIDVRRTFRLFRPRSGEVTQLAAIHPDEPILIGFFDDEDAFVQAAWQYAGARNLYFSVHAFAKGRVAVPVNRPLAYARTRGVSEDVVRVRGLPLDFDVNTPRRREAKALSPTNQAAATIEELNDAFARVSAILSFSPFVSERHSGIMSGNGFQVIPKLDLLVNSENRIDVAKRLKSAGELIRRTFSTPDLRIDLTFDLPRVFALPGTLKKKGSDPALWRMVQFVQEGDASAPAFGRWFQSIPVEASQTKAHAAPGRICPGNTQTDQVPAELCPLWRALFLGQISSGDRSVDLVLLGTRLLWHGFEPDEVAEQLVQSDAIARQKYFGRPDAAQRYRAIAEDDAPFRTPDCSFVRKLPGAPHCTPCRFEVDFTKRPLIQPVVGSGRRDLVGDPFKEMARIVAEVLP